MMRKLTGPFLPLRIKFIILFVVLIIIPFAVSGAITYSRYTSDVERTSGEFADQLAQQIRFNLDRYVKEMERLTLAPLYDEAVLSIMNKHSGPYAGDSYLPASEQNKMTLFLSSLSFSRSEIRGIYLFGNDGTLFSEGRMDIGNTWTEQGNEWMNEVIAAEGGLVIVEPHQAVYHHTPGEDRVISIARALRDPNHYARIGIISVDLPASQFQQIFSQVKFTANSKLRIVNAEGEVLYPDPAIVQEQPDGVKEVLEASAVSDYTGMTISAYIPLADLHKDAIALSRFTAFISILSLAAACVLAVVSANHLVKPIRHLQSKMKLVRQGALSERATVTTQDEIGQLTESFNGMIVELEHLVKEVYETKLREKDAALSALQSQMNPHFLYNTLETMNMLAIQKDQYELSGLVTSLGRLLRYTVDHEERFVLLSDELSFCEAYLQIQSYRLNNRLRTEIYVDPSLYGARIPKLLLQPFIENVIDHALEDRVVHMTIKADTQGDDLLLRIQDDGAGLSAERAAQLIQSLHRRDMETGSSSGGPAYGQRRRGFALRNVHQRLQLMYGAEYGLTLERTERGSSFCVRMPFEWEE
ncbi:sensor histidine kinase [Paenibacillus sp. GCM10023252]|uniref:cache domain-containing sensor histidine kinase n=1 Tax=Paenibacillus sp. GCM10023252 TaxID=3252649 RepID=UPI00361980D8